MIVEDVFDGAEQESQSPPKILGDFPLRSPVHERLQDEMRRKWDEVWGGLRAPNSEYDKLQAFANPLSYLQGGLRLMFDYPDYTDEKGLQLLMYYKHYQPPGFEETAPELARLLEKAKRETAAMSRFDADGFVSAGLTPAQAIALVEKFLNAVLVHFDECFPVSRYSRGSDEDMQKQRYRRGMTDAVSFVRGHVEHIRHQYVGQELSDAVAIFQKSLQEMTGPTHSPAARFVSRLKSKGMK